MNCPLKEVILMLGMHILLSFRRKAKFNEA